MDQFLVATITADFLDRLELQWAGHPTATRRLPLLHDALKAHKLGMFAVSIPTLFAQFEGLVADLMKHEGKMGGQALLNHIATLTANEAEAGGSESVMGAMLSSFVVDAFLARFEHGLPPPPLSRHAVLHGGDVQYGNETNSRTAILLIDQLLDISQPL